jgi:hypothetical protein
MHARIFFYFLKAVKIEKEYYLTCTKVGNVHAHKKKIIQVKKNVILEIVCQCLRRVTLANKLEGLLNN